MTLRLPERNPTSNCEKGKLLEAGGFQGILISTANFNDPSDDPTRLPNR